MAEQLLGLPVANALSERVAARAAELTKGGVTPTLAIIRVGERDDDLSYERGALKRCDPCMGLLFKLSPNSAEESSRNQLPFHAGQI